MTGKADRRTGGTDSRADGRDAKRIDGRRARRDRNRREVVEAALTLVEEGVTDPPIKLLTERSGLSARSIFRYFDGLDDLRRAVIKAQFERVSPILDGEHAGEGALEARIKRFVETRVRFNEAIQGPARTAQMRAAFAPVIAEDIAYYRSVLDASLRREFAPELRARSRSEAEDLVAAIDILVSFDAWRQLTSTHGRSRSQVKRVWTYALEALLAR